MDRAAVVASVDSRAPFVDHQPVGIDLTSSIKNKLACDQPVAILNFRFIKVPDIFFAVGAIE